MRLFLNSFSSLFPASNKQLKQTLSASPLMILGTLKSFNKDMFRLFFLESSLLVARQLYQESKAAKACQNDQQFLEDLKLFETLVSGYEEIFL